MRHVRQIRNIIDEGHYSEAHAALNQLLSLGPNNIEALKLKSILYAQEGRFDLEASTWEQVLSVDGEDMDAIYFFQRRHLEDREAFYFSDPLPAGGRRFIAHPKGLINAALFGLFGCALFLFCSSLTRQYYFFAVPVVTGVSFIAFVLTPWILIIYFYFVGLKEVELTSEGITIATRLRRVTLKWQDVSSVYVVHGSDPFAFSLNFLLRPVDQGAATIEIDLARESTAIRARLLFVSEVCRLYGEPTYTSQESLGFSPKKVLHF